MQLRKMLEQSDTAAVRESLEPRALPRGRSGSHVAWLAMLSYRAQPPTQAVYYLALLVGVGFLGFETFVWIEQ